MQSLSQAEVGDLDELDGPVQHPLKNSSSHEIRLRSGARALDDAELQFVDRLVSDDTRSPSNYTTGKCYASLIPASPTHTRAPKTRKRIAAQRPLSQTQVLQAYTLPASDAGPQIGATRSVHEGSRSCDLLVQDAFHFTNERPFRPRTLKSNRKSKLVESNNYAPPKRKVSHRDDVDGGARGSAGARTHARPVSAATRPGTANTLASTTDFMSASIISRDKGRRESPHDVPALDISLDQDHIKWLKEQQTQARLRGSDRSPTRPTADLGDTRQSFGETRNGWGDTRQSLGDSRKSFGRSTALNTFTLHDSMHVSG